MPSVEEPGDVGHLCAILFLVDFQHARPWAPLDLILKARARGSHPELGVRARAQLKVPIHQPQRLPGRSRGMIGPEVLRSVGLGPADDFEPGPRLLRVEPQRQELLVVAKLHVVLGWCELDELVFEQRSFLVGVRDERLDVCGLAFETTYERTHVARPRLEVAAHAVPEAARLTHVQHLPAGTMKDIDPW